MITLHPNSKQLLKHYRNDELLLAPIALTISHEVMQKAKDVSSIATTHHQLSGFSGLGIPDLLRKHFGKHDDTIEGKYRKAHFYAFEYRHQTLIVRAEKGEAGSKWFWVLTPEMHAQRKKEHPIDLEESDVIDVLPAFFTELHEVFFKRDLDPGGFSPRANQKRQLWRIEPQRQDLDQSTPVVKSMSPRRSL